MTARLLVGDVRAVLASLPERSVHCCVTSPPYFGLRDYGTAQWDGGDAGCDHVQKNGRNDTTPERLAERAAQYGTGQGEGSKVTTIQYRDTCGKCGAVRVDRQIGLEGSLSEYITTLVAVFRDVRRVLRDDGTCWLNMGSSFSSAIIESDEYIIRDDLTDAERAYVYAELATHYRAESEALSSMRQTDASTEPTLPLVLASSARPTSKLCDEGV